MRRMVMIVLLAALASASSGCMATRKFVRGEVNTSSDKLSGRIDSNTGEINEAKDGISRNNDKINQVNGKVTQLDATTNTQGQKIESLNGQVSSVDQKAGQAQSAADKANTQVVMLDGKFENRNQFSVATTKAVLFKFDSAKLDSKYQSDLDEAAQFLSTNPNAIAVLEGHTDSAGDKDYNVKLGERRLESVKRYLAVEKSVPIYRIHELSLGAEKPIAENKSREGREQNRAVTLTILVPGNGSE